MNIEKQLKIYALDNAIKYKGKASAGAVIGQVINAYPEWKAKMKELQPSIQAVLKEVNAMTVFEQTALLKELAPEMLEPKEKKVREGLKELNKAYEGKVVLRFEPSPSGAMHIGHSVTGGINVEYAHMYKGKLILRISDTNPDNIYEPAYELLVEDMKWLYGKDPEVVIQSDRMESYYNVGLKLLEEKNAYVCDCDPLDFKSLRDKQLPCSCRVKGVEEQTTRWHNMFTTYEPGDVVVRVKTDIRHKNPALRDFPIFRINTSEHARQGTKYRVWPLMNMSVAVDDYELGLTHVVRAKDQLDNTRKQMYIYDHMGWDKPEFIHIGMINFEGLKLSASEMSQGVRDGVYTGWDDIRLPTLQAMKRRGYRAQAFINWVRSMGVTMVDKRVEAGEFYKSLDAFNRSLVEPEAKRYFFVIDPKEIEIVDAPEQEIELHLHPEHMHGGRSLKAHTKYLMDAVDVEKLSVDKLYRLMDCCNFMKQDDGTFKFNSLDVDVYRKAQDGIFHWLPADDNVDVQLCMPDGSILTGKGESALKDIEEGTVVQFERKGFAKYDHSEGETLIFWWLHK